MVVRNGGKVTAEPKYHGSLEFGSNKVSKIIYVGESKVLNILWLNF